MTKEEFKKVKIGDYVQLTTRGDNKGKIGIVVKILPNSSTSGRIYLRPYDCEFCFAYEPKRCERGGMTPFSYKSVKYLGKSPII
jgi:hypothetical protein